MSLERGDTEVFSDAEYTPVQSVDAIGDKTEIHHSISIYDVLDTSFIPQHNIEYYGVPQRILGTGIAGVTLQFSGGKYTSPVAIKGYKNDHGSVCANALMEVAALKHLSRYHCPYIVSLIDVVSVEGASILPVLAVEEYGNLIDAWYTIANQGEWTIRHIAYEICAGLAYLHGVGVLHGDVKPHNILIGGVPSNLQARWCDFGGSTVRYTERLEDLHGGEDDEFYYYCSTIPYRAPELLTSSSPNTTAAETWSLGLVLHYVFMGVDFAPKLSRETNILNHLKVACHAPVRCITKCNYSERYCPCDSMKELVGDLLQWLPSNRPSAYALLSNELFSDLTKTSIDTLIGNGRRILHEERLVESYEIEYDRTYIQWLVHAWRLCGYSERTLQLTLRLVDEFLTKNRDVGRDDLHCVVSVGIILISRLVEPVHLEKANTPEDRLSSSVLRTMEQRLLSCVNYKLYAIVPYDYSLPFAVTSNEYKLNSIIRLVLSTSSLRFYLLSQRIADLACRTAHWYYHRGDVILSQRDVEYIVGNASSLFDRECRVIGIPSYAMFVEDVKQYAMK